MTSCKTCLDYIKNGDFCRPLSQDYQEWFSSREYFCDRTYVYGSLLFHSLNNISTHALHENTCKRHAEERQRILNHFTFLADPANINIPGYFTGSSVRRDVGYILRRNLKSQTYTLYKDSAHEEKISEVNCEVLLPVGDNLEYHHQDVFWTFIEGLPEGYVYAKLQVTANVDFVIPILVLDKPFTVSSRIAPNYTKLWTSTYREQPILQGFAKIVSDCYGTFNGAFENSIQSDAARKFDSHSFFKFLLHHVGVNVLDIVQQQLDFILPCTEDMITQDSVLDISRPASQLRNPILSFPSVQFLLKVLFLRRNMLALRSDSIHGSVFAAVNQSFSSYLSENIGDDSLHFVMNNYDITSFSR